MITLRKSIAMGTFVAALALLVAQGIPCHAGEKIQFSNPDRASLAKNADLKQKNSLAPENLAGVRLNNGVNADMLVPPQNEGNSMLTDKKRLQALEDRKNWLKTGSEAKSEQGQFDQDGNASKDGTAADATDSKRREIPKDRQNLTAQDLNRAVNSSTSENTQGNQRTGNNESTAFGKGRSEPLNFRANSQAGPGMFSPAELRETAGGPRANPFAEQREAMRKADMEHFRNMLNPPSGNALGSGNFGGGPSRTGASLSGNGGAAFNPAGGGAGQNFSRGLDPRMGPAAGGSGFQNGSPGFNPGAGNLVEPPKQAPKPTVLQIPKRNF